MASQSMVAHIMNAVVKSSISPESFCSAERVSAARALVGGCDMPDGVSRDPFLWRRRAARLSHGSSRIRVFPDPEFPMSMADRDGFIWYDGKLVPWRDATTHVLTHSLHYGLAVFEGVRAYKTESLGTAIFRLKEHTD